LWVRSNHLTEEIAKSKDATAVQIAQLNTSQETARDEYAAKLESLKNSVNSANSVANTAVARTRSEAQKSADQLSQLNGRLEENQAHVSSELSRIDTETASKLTEVASNVTGVKTDVDGVKTEVTDVKAQVVSAHAALEQQATDLKRMTGDMGVISDRIATNSKDLDALRALGERSYYEFALSKSTKTKKVGDLLLTFKKADVKRNRYTVEVAADDKRIEKKDKTVNEPVQIFVAGNRQASEIVVNQVNKDEIVGYVSVPKVIVSRR
jgi:chromosome segregation ATPase